MVASQGIQNVKIVPKSSQMNTSKLHQRIIWDKAKCLMLIAGTLPSVGLHALTYAAWIKNRIYTRRLVKFHTIIGGLNLTCNKQERLDPKPICTFRKLDQTEWTGLFQKLVTYLDCTMKMSETKLTFQIIARANVNGSECGLDSAIQRSTTWWRQPFRYWWVVSL